MLTLREARSKRFLTQRELAERADVSKTTIVNIEQGTPPRPTNARKIAAALEFEPGEIDWPKPSNGKVAGE